MLPCLQDHAVHEGDIRIMLARRCLCPSFQLNLAEVLPLPVRHPCHPARERDRHVFTRAAAGSHLLCQHMPASRLNRPPMVARRQMANGDRLCARCQRSCYFGCVLAGLGQSGQYSDLRISARYHKRALPYARGCQHVKAMSQPRLPQCHADPRGVRTSVSSARDDVIARALRINNGCPCL